MGLRDAFKSRKGAGEEEDLGVPTAGGGEDNDADWFRPKQNGVYQGGPDGYRFLRFHVTGRVYLAAGPELDAVGPELGPQNPDPIVGQYTGAGRFVVQRKFERPIVFTALDTDDTGITVRLTTEAAQTGEYRYEFVADPESA